MPERVRYLRLSQYVQYYTPKKTNGQSDINNNNGRFVEFTLECKQIYPIWQTIVFFTEIANTTN